mmetsp:Transcript_6380/g.8161  ORF Transcript_6380/g.8161 Transcript_6380/m.8161 type:complete len:369 (+) Transcript_6380:1-1107(+)
MQKQGLRPTLEWLRDGVNLCLLANKLKPGSVKRINRSTQHEHMIANVQAFLQVAPVLGGSVFKPEALVDGTDLPSVYKCILSIKQAQQSGTSPSKSVPPPPKEPQVKQISRPKQEMSKGSTPPRPPAEKTSKQETSKGSTPPAENGSDQIMKLQKQISQLTTENATLTQQLSAAQTEIIQLKQKLTSKPTPKPAANLPPPKMVSTTPEKKNLPKYESPRPPGVSPDGYSLANPVRAEPAVGGRGGGFGLSADIEKKKNQKYDFEAERAVCNWITKRTGKRQVGNFADWLHDGQVLCLLANAISPGSIKKVETSSMPFKQMENISAFLKFARKFGVTEHTLFETVDLYDHKDLGIVIRCLLALKSLTEN